MEFSLAALTIITLSLSCLYFLWSFTRNNRKSSPANKPPPVAGGARPFTGHLHLFNDPTKLSHMHLASLADKHGPIFTVRLGMRRLLMVNNWEVAKELFTTHDVTVSSRPIITAARQLGYNLAMFGWTPYGNYWRDMRKLVSVHLLSGRRLETLHYIPASETARFVNELYYKWKSKEGTRLSVDMSQWFGDLNLNVIMRMVAGKRFYDDGSEAEEGRRTREVMREFFHLSGLIIPADVFPFLRWFDIGGLEKKMEVCVGELDRIVGLWVEEHKVKKSGDEDHKQQRDFMDVMLEQLRSDEKLSGLDVDATIKATCVSLISGGTDTTSLILVWTLAHLVNDPRILKRAQEELDSVVGRERRVQESDISSLVYLQAICKEAFRLHPASHLGGPRVFREDATVGSYHIPKGTWLMLNLWKLHRDPKVWGDDALEFRPERFLEAHKDMDVLGTDYELLPFGAGRRICPGTQLGVQILKIVMANLLQSFDLWREHADEPVDMAETAGMTNAKATPLQVLVSPRLAPNLY